MLVNGHYVGITNTWPITGATYQALDSYGAASSVMTKNIAVNQLVGAMYDFNSAAIPVVAPGQLHSVTFPSYGVSSGEVISSSLEEGLSHLADTTSVSGPAGYTFTVSIDESNPFVVHMHRVAANGSVADFDVTASGPYNGNFNLSVNNGVVTLTGLAAHTDNGAYAVTTVAMDFGVNGSNFGESYIISHTVGYTTGENYWRVNKAVRN